MRNPNPDGSIVWDKAANQEVVYAMEPGVYVHASCVHTGWTPQHTLATVNPRSCYVCGAQFNTVVRSHTGFHHHFL